MPNYVGSALLSNSTDATYRAWGKAISDGLAAVGMVKTSDTGQVDWTTATVPAANASRYEIWRFNDSYQAADPMFLRIEYGTGSATSFLSLVYRVGRGTDGAGNLTSPRASRISTWGATTNATPFWISSDGSYLNIFLSNPRNTGTASKFPFSFLSIDRFRDVTNTPVGAGYLMVHTIYSTSSYMGPAWNNSSPNVSIFSSMYSKELGDWSPDYPGIPSNLGASSFATGISSGVIYSSMPVVYAPRGYYISAWVPLFANDAGTGFDLPTTALGMSMTYRSLSGSINTASPTPTSTQEGGAPGWYGSVAMRWV